MPACGETLGTAGGRFGRRLGAIALGLSLAGGSPHAQPADTVSTPAPRWPTPQAIERARTERPLPPIKAAPGAARPLPRIGSDPPGAPTGHAFAAPGLDIATLARQGGALTGGASVTDQAPPAPTLRIFLTLDMPRGSLQRLVEQAERSGATLVLRGLRNQSMRQTLAAVSEVLGQRPVGWLIDPEAFDRHGVQVAPTFVLTLGAGATPQSGAAPACSSTACPVLRPFVSVSGDVSLAYALDHIARRHPGAAPAATAYLARLRPR